MVPKLKSGKADAETCKARMSIPAGRKRRLSQKERSHITREKIIAAAFDLLHLQGYAGASTASIAKEAGISLGALQHQFPSKALLMAAVVRRFAAIRILSYRAALKGVAQGLPRFEALNQASWNLIGTKELIASMEIEMASRNDPELASAVRPTLARHSAFVTRLVSRLIGKDGALNDQRIESLRILNNAIMFGMSIEYIRETDKALIDNALRIWRDCLFNLASDQKD